MGETYCSSPFWNMTRKIEHIIGIPNYSCAWSNINRYDHNGAEPTGAILDEIKKLDYLIAEEINIIRPDVCMFFINRKYDDRLHKLFPGIRMEAIAGLPFNHFVWLQHAALPKYCFRTPHPKKIRMQKWEELFINAMKRILPNTNKNQ